MRAAEKPQKSGAESCRKLNNWAVALIQRWSDGAVQADQQKLRDDQMCCFSDHITAKKRRFCLVTQRCGQPHPRFNSRDAANNP